MCYYGQANTAGKAWDLLEPTRLFIARDEDGDLYDAAHLAEMIATLGPPPPDYLAKNPERRADFWDDQVMFPSSLRATTGDVTLINLQENGWVLHLYPRTGQWRNLRLASKITRAFLRSFEEL